MKHTSNFMMYHEPTGDCTGQACMCDRCYFERLAEKETVNWGKQSGSTELARYLNDKKENI